MPSPPREAAGHVTSSTWRMRLSGYASSQVLSKLFSITRRCSRYLFPRKDSALWCSPQAPGTPRGTNQRCSSLSSCSSMRQNSGLREADIEDITKHHTNHIIYVYTIKWVIKNSHHLKEERASLTCSTSMYKNTRSRQTFGRIALELSVARPPCRWSHT